MVRARRRERDPSGSERTSERACRIRERAWLGVRGGLVATVVMTAFRLPISRSLPPTARFWTTYVSSGSEDVVGPAVALHLLYGAAAGVPYATLVTGRSDESTWESEVVGVLAGAAYGLFLSAFGVRVVLGRVLGMELSPDERLVFHVGHAVYGLTLGEGVGSRTAS